jgi:hypothetical protein
VNELSLISVSGFRSKHDDFIDTISMLPKMQAWRPSEEAPMAPSSKGDGMWDMEIEDSDGGRMASYIV